MNILIGTLLLLYAAAMAFYCRPVQKESLGSLVLCVMSGVIALLSAPPVSAAMGFILLLLQAALAGIYGRLLLAERRERLERSKRRRVRKPRQNETSSERPQRPRIAG